MAAGISVIICCYNSAERLPETLKHLALQQFSATVQWEIIVIDNASTDATSIVAAKEWQQYVLPEIAFTILNEPIPGKNNALKTGIKNAAHDYVLVCDDDNWLYPDFVERSFNIMQADDSISALGGCGIFEPEQPILNGVDKFKSSYVNGAQTWAATEHWTYGAGTTYSKRVFSFFLHNNKAWVNSTNSGEILKGGEDVEICFLMHLAGHRIVADDNLLFKHFVPHKRQNEIYLLELSFWNSWTNVLFYSYYHLFNHESRPIKQVLKNWFWSAAKALFKTQLLLVKDRLISRQQITTAQKFVLKQRLGTFYSLLKNRQKISVHHAYLKQLFAIDKPGYQNQQTELTAN